MFYLSSDEPVYQQHQGQSGPLPLVHRKPYRKPGWSGQNILSIPIRTKTFSKGIAGSVVRLRKGAWYGNGAALQLVVAELAMSPLCTFLLLRIASQDTDSCQASHVTQSCLVPSCRLNSSASVLWGECLQQPREGEPLEAPAAIEMGLLLN